jgi:hypothetical protein
MVPPLFTLRSILPSPSAPDGEGGHPQTGPGVGADGGSHAPRAWDIRGLASRGKLGRQQNSNEPSRRPENIPARPASRGPRALAGVRARRPGGSRCTCAGVGSPGGRVNSPGHRAAGSQHSRTDSLPPCAWGGGLGYAEELRGWSETAGTWRPRHGLGGWGEREREGNRVTVWRRIHLTSASALLQQQLPRARTITAGFISIVVILRGRTVLADPSLGGFLGAQPSRRCCARARIWHLDRKGSAPSKLLGRC